jgi:hypothetical protein
VFILNVDFGSSVRSLAGTLVVFVVWSVLEFLRDQYWPYLFSFLPSVYNLQSLPTLIISFVIVFVLFTILSMRRRPVGVMAYLFFPKYVPESARTLELHEALHGRRVIVNHKTKPVTAYYLSPNTYAWRLIKKRAETLWVSETDTEPDNPEFVEKWCQQKGYLLLPHIPDRKELLWAGSIHTSYQPNPVYDYLEYRIFFPFYRRFLPKRGMPQKRIFLNWSTMEAFPFDMARWDWAVGGQVRGHSEIAGLRRHHAQKWAKEHGFTWTDKIPSDEELFKKKSGNVTSLSAKLT